MFSKMSLMVCSSIFWSQQLFYADESADYLSILFSNKQNG